MISDNAKKLMLIRIIDDDEELRTSYRFLLEGEGWFVRTYDSAESFLAHDNFKTPGCAIVDIRMEGMSGLELQDELNRQGIKLPLIFLTGHGTVETAVDTLEAGAVTFLTKPAPLPKLREAVGKALAIAEELEGAALHAIRWKSLTPKEKDVAKLVSKGLLNKQIADELGMAERTTQTHRTMVYRKLEARNAIEVYKILEVSGFAE